MSFEIASLEAGGGTLGICPIPGRDGGYAADLDLLFQWKPQVVLTMTEQVELERVGARDFAQDLKEAGIGWIHLPIRDFGAPQGQTLDRWAQASANVKTILNDGGRVLVHCFGGCGRSGMAIMRVMVELGEEPDAALARLRSVRPCALETAPQIDWARNGQ
ncbi:protein phosphatase [Shimia thalassica]|uniref:phosphatase domain-containing putative toxin n=1 Tax=Shimia thalassica TaxID=1715693 RepID=UPI0026E257DF|nr:protein phosphatase [Shimia thalassica]MDO6521801.1 protein phosphatase [Shimia thalassica]